jgi:hypothetical protein
MFLAMCINYDLRGDMSISMAGASCRGSVIVEGQWCVEIFCNLRNKSRCIHPVNPKGRTLGEALIRSQASPYRTVGEFLENSSDVKEYTRSTDSPAPNRITVRLVVLAVVRITGSKEIDKFA